MLDHMSSTGVMHGDGRRHGERMVKHEVKKKNIAAVHVWYRNTSSKHKYKNGKKVKGPCLSFCTLVCHEN